MASNNHDGRRIFVPREIRGIPQQQFAIRAKLQARIAAIDVAPIPPESPQLTAYAAQYGVAREDWLASFLKSGLTPIDITFDPNQSAEDFVLHEFLHRSQRLNCHNFTTRELYACGAISGLDNEVILPSNLSGILPLFDRRRWELDELSYIDPMFPLPFGIPGHWTARNDIVWNALLPVLCLASKYIDHADLFDW